MTHTPIEDDTGHPTAIISPRITTGRLSRSFRRASASTVPERVALGMIARHGAGAAQEAITHLNRMIDLGDNTGRDLWACVVHVIHDRRR